MRFMMMIKANENYEAGTPPKQELIAAIGQLSQEMARKGVLLEAGGLLPSAAGARVRVAGGEMVVIDGPFAETKELIGGFSIMQAESKADAIEMARQFMALHKDILGAGYEGECEVRQMYDPDQPCGGKGAA